MKNLFLILTIIVIFISCKSEKERMLSKMADNVKEMIEEQNFKRNKTVEIFEYKPIDYTIKDVNYVDSMNLISNSVFLDASVGILKSQSSILKLRSQQAELYASMFGAKDILTKLEIDKFKEENEKYENYVDTVNKYLRIDSLIKKRIKNRKKPKDIYMFNVYIKMSSVDNKTKEKKNIADTLSYLFDENLVLIKNLYEYASQH